MCACVCCQTRYFLRESLWFPLKPILNFQERIVISIDKIHIDKIQFLWMDDER